MAIALDTNMLIPMFRMASAEDERVATRVLALLDEGPRVLIPVFCAGEAWRSLTEPNGYGHDPDEVRAFITRLLGVATLITPESGIWDELARILSELRPRGAAIFDCFIAATCIEAGASAIWTVDHKFPRLRELPVINPLTS